SNFIALARNDVLTIRIKLPVDEMKSAIRTGLTLKGGISIIDMSGAFDVWLYRHTKQTEHMGSFKGQYARFNSRFLNEAYSIELDGRNWKYGRPVERNPPKTD